MYKKDVFGKKFILLILSYVDTALTCVWLFLTRGNFEANILKVLRTLSGPDTEAIKVNAETISTLNFVKLRQGSGKDGQGLVNKRPPMAPNGLKGLSTLAKSLH